MSSNCSAKKSKFDFSTSGVVHEYELTINSINMNIFFFNMLLIFISEKFFHKFIYIG